MVRFFGKGVGDSVASCVFFNYFLLIVDFSKLQGVCELLEVDTAPDKIELLFILILSSVVPHHRSQLAMLPPCMLANVAPVL